MQTQKLVKRLTQLSLLSLLIQKSVAQINITTLTTVANPTAANALTNPLGIVVSGVTGELRITGAGTYTFGANPAQVIFLNGGNPTNGAFRTQGVNATVVNPFELQANSAIFVQGGANTMTLTGTISGVGGLEKRGGGILDLVAANSFSGAVLVQNGELRLSHLQAIQNASSVTVNAGNTLQLNVAGTNNWQLGTGAIFLNGGTLRQFSGLETDIARINQTINITGTSTINAPGDSRIYAAGDITGTGNLNKAGGGELRFTGTPKTYTGVTNINNGRIRIDDTGIPINTTAFNLNGGNLRFGQRRFREYSLGAGGNAPINIIGTSSIEYTDQEGARLTNPISVTGTGNFRSRIAGSVFEFTGPLTGNGTLRINQGTTSNPIQAGTIFINGDASAFAGDIEVLQSALRVGQNTTLGANNFDLASNSRLAIDIAGQNTFGSLALNNATLNAYSLIVPNFQSGLRSGRYSLDIIQATGAITDLGVGVANTNLTRATLNNTGNVLQLLLDVDYTGYGLRLNDYQRQFARYLNRARGGEALQEIRRRALNLGSGSEIRRFYESVSAEELGGLMDSALIHAQNQLRFATRNAPHLQTRFGLHNHLGVSPMQLDTLVDPKILHSGKTMAMHSRSLERPEPEWAVFGDVFLNRQQRYRDFYLGGYEANAQGVLFGADKFLTSNIAVGLFGSYEHSRTEFDHRRGWVDANSVGAGLMASYVANNFHATIGAQYLRHFFETERYTVLGTARGRPDANQLATILQTGYDLKFGRFSITPTASLQYNYLWVDDFSENGSLAAQRFTGLDADSLVAGAGARVGYLVPGCLVSWRPEIFAEYRRELLDSDRTITARLKGSRNSYNFKTPGRSEDYVAVGGGLQFAFTDSTSAYVQYEAQLADEDYISHAVFAGFRWYLPGGPLNDPVIKFSDDQSGWVNSFWRSYAGQAVRAIGLRGLMHLQMDHSQTENKGREKDVRDPDTVNKWTLRRFRLYAERDLGLGFFVDAAGEFDEHPDQHRAPFALFSGNIGWNLFEAFTIKAGYDRVPLSWEETTPSWQLKRIERSAANRIFTGLGDMGDSHLRVSVGGTYREAFTNLGPIERVDLIYEFAVANPREGADAAWEGDPTGILPHWPEPSYFLRLGKDIRTNFGSFEIGCDLAKINAFKARSSNQPTEAEAISPYLNYTFGWFNLSAQWFGVDYSRAKENGGFRRRPSGFTITPSLFIHPKWELVYSYSQFDTNGDEAIRLNSAVRQAATSYPFNRRFDNIYQHYFGVNHYIKGNDLKLMFGVENTHADGTAERRSVRVEDNWTIRARLQWMF